jgi:hypothetical protein
MKGRIIEIIPSTAALSCYYPMLLLVDEKIALSLAISASM